MKKKKKFKEELFLVAEVGNFLRHTGHFVSFSGILKKVLPAFFEIIQDILGIKLYTPLQSRSDFYRISSTIRDLVDALSNKKIIKTVTKTNRRYHDEPYFIKYSVRLSDTILLSDADKSVGKIAGGSDLEPERALMKALGEAIERYCLGIYREKNFLRSSRAQIGDEAIDLNLFATLANKQRKLAEFQRWRFNDGSIFQWDKCFSLIDKRPIFIPAQLIYVPYKYIPKEPIIQLPISTGAAAGCSLEEALYRGICEVVERDAFMITYLNKISPPIIDLASSQDSRLKKILTLFERYNLGLYVLDITTDIGLPTVLVIVIDRTGIGPAVSVGTKTSLNILEAIIGAIYETQKTRLWIRGEMDKGYNLEDIKSRADKIKNFIDRGLFWSPLEMIKKIEFLFHGPQKKISNMEFSDLSLDYQTNYQKILSLFIKKEIPLYVKDLTIKEVDALGFKVVKVIIPQFHPLYLWEQFRYLEGKRLHQSSSSKGNFNNIPHPFL